MVLWMISLLASSENDPREHAAKMLVPDASRKQITHFGVEVESSEAQVPVPVPMPITGSLHPPPLFDISTNLHFQKKTNHRHHAKTLPHQCNLPPTLPNPF